MPPKPQPGKKGKDDQEDYSDVHTLPPLNSVIATILMKDFFSLTTREKLQKYMQEKLPLEPRIKTLTREELIAYAKLKQIIIEPNVAASLPQDDPRLKMTEAEQLSKAACDKMFELSVLARRAKKEKIQKLEEEAKLQQLQPGDNTLDQDGLDLIFNLVDFPNTREEAMAMAKYNMTVNCVIDVQQVRKEAADEEEQEAISSQESYAFNGDPNYDGSNYEKVTNRLNALKDARDSSARNSPLRHLYITQLAFVNWPEITFKTNELGEEVEERKEADQVFLAKLIQKLEHTGALLVKYRRFREKVPLIPLMPDKYSMKEIELLQQESQEYYAWLQDGEQMINLNQSQKSASDPQYQEELQKRQQRKQEFESEKVIRAQEEEERQKRIKELRENLKVSLDDAKDYSNFNLNGYNRDFIGNKESKNCLSAIMSAMVSQIANGDPHYTSFQSQDEHNKSTEPDTIDDLFDDLEKEITYDLQIQERPMNQSQLTNNYDKQCTQNRVRKQGTQAFASQQTVIGEVEYHEECDKSKLPLFKLQKEVASNDEEKAEDVCLREKNVLNNLVLPGFQRHLMPKVPSKSERIRDQERPALYPFSTLPIEDTERALILKAFQDMIKSNFIDEGQPSHEKHHKYKTFERCFEQHMSPEILRQVMAEALLKEPDVATLYYPRNDSLLVAFYNKIKDIQRKEGELHGEREWKAAYRVMPDFQNWVKFFSEELIVPMAQNNKASHATLPRYQMDEEMIPDQMLDIDDQKTQNITEKSQMFYPMDGSIMKVDTYTIGGKEYQKSVVFKDNLTFGIRRSQPQQPVPEEEKEYGLYSIEKSDVIEFWLNFENETRVLVEGVKYTQNPQRMIRIDPPKPTPEEIAAREEAIKQAQALNAKNKNKKDWVPIVEEYKEPEPTWEPEPLDFLDSVFTNSFIHNGDVTAQVTTTLANGLIVKHMADGSIVQLFEDQLFDSKIEEKDRVIMSNSAVVVRHFRNRDAEVLFPHGEIAYFNKKEMLWTITNNKGKRVAKKAGISWDLDPIPCATETDAVTNAKMMIREDKVLTIQFKDGSLYCQHADGTLFKTSADGNEIRIEKEGYAPVICRKGLRTEQGSDLSEQRKIFDSKQRALGGYLMETHLHDGTVVETFRDVLMQQMGVRHLFRRPDFTVVSIDSAGQIDIISSNARSSMNEQNGRRLMGQDVDYCKALYLSQESINYFGVYHAFILPNRDMGIFTVDETYQNLYSILDNFSIQKSANSYVWYGAPTSQEVMSQRSNFQVDVGATYDIEQVGGYKNPSTKHYIFPRLFVVNADGSGYELLTKEQLDYYFRIAKHREESLKQRRTVMVGTTMAKTHYFVTKVKNMSDFDLESQQLKLLDFPQNAQYALFHNRTPQKTTADKNVNQSRQLPNQYLFRQIFEFQEFEAFKQEAFYDDFNRYRQWKMSQVRYETEFGIQHLPAKDYVPDYQKIENDEYFARRIITKILKERRNKRAKFDPDNFKRLFMSQIESDKEMNDFYKRGNTFMAGEINIEDQSQNQLNDKQAHLMHMQETANQEKIKQIKRKQQAQINNQIEEIRKMVNTPAFLPAYFASKDGQQFTKNNPQKPPSQELITRMSQRINRSQHGSEKAASQFDGNQSMRDGTSPVNNAQLQQDGGDDNQSPIVALEPEDHYGKNASNFMKSKKMTQGGSGPQPSLYLQEKMYVKQREQEQILKAEEYHVIKTKDFNVVGRLRQEKPYVKSIQKSNIPSELNEKFITTECIADRRVKISSMAQRQYINAPSIEDVRKQGQHQMILSAINKKQTFAELINQANSMVTSVLHDPLKRSVNIMPSQLKFGMLQAGAGPFELILTVKNEDQLAQRITVRPFTDKRLKFEQLETGPIATGMVRKISVFVQADEECTINDSLQIVTKTDIYKIPIEAQFLSPENYQKELQEQRALSGKTLGNSKVRNKLNDSIQRGRMSAKGERAGGYSINGGSDDEGNMVGNKQPNWIETTQSDSRLPQIPNINSRPFEVDPKKNLKDLLRK